MTSWSEDVDKLLSDSDKRMAVIEQRIHNLERKRNRQN